MVDNILYYGDNLDVLRRHVKNESVDLVYLDPPFNSKRAYNVLFANQQGQPTVCAYYDGDRKVRLCPECLERMRREPGAWGVLLAEGSSRRADAYPALPRPSAAARATISRPTSTLLVVSARTPACRAGPLSEVGATLLTGSAGAGSP